MCLTSRRNETKPRRNEVLMALTRKMLSAMGIEEKVIDQIIDAHTETVDGLKSDLEKAEKEAVKVAGLQAELDEAKKQASTDTDLQAKLDSLQREYDEFKLKTEAAQKQAEIKNAYLNLIRETGIEEKRANAIVRITDLSGMELDENGSLVNAEELTNAIKTEWSEFIPTTQTKGATVENPPSGTAGGMTKDEIMKIKDAGERQKAIQENPQAFGY